MEEEKKTPSGDETNNGTPSPSPSKKKQKQVHGILKSGKKDGRKSGVVWDEDNLIYNESNKSATMKIDEPPTPYNKEYDSSGDDEEESTSSSEKEKGSKSDDDGEVRTSSTAIKRNHREDIKTEADARAHFDQVSTALEESARRPARTARPRFSSDDDTTEDDEGEGPNHAQFKQKRMQHYNEWKKLQEFRRSQSTDASDEEEEEDDKERDDDDTRTAKALRS